MNRNTKDLSDTYWRSSDIFRSIFDEIGKVIVGQHEAITQMLIAILCEDMPLSRAIPGLARHLQSIPSHRYLTLNSTGYSALPT